MTFGENSLMDNSFTGQKYLIIPKFCNYQVTEGARQRTRRHTVVFQVYANKADWVKSVIPNGAKHGKIAFITTHMKSELIFYC